jgi:hypothetical protein
MPTATYEINIYATAGLRHSIVPAIDAGAWNALPRNARLTIPPITDRSQAYYWKQAWQRDEAQALEDIAAGRVRVFVDPAAAVEYLLSDED